MLMHLIRKAKIKFFVPGEAGDAATQRPGDRLGPEPLAQAFRVRRLSAEQQRIELLEVQNRQLRADIARWKNSSIGFAHEMRKLLND